MGVVIENVLSFKKGDGKNSNFWVFLGNSIFFRWQNRPERGGGGLALPYSGM